MKKFFKRAGVILAILVVIGMFMVNRYGPIIGSQMGKPIYLFHPSPQRYGEIAIELMGKNGYYAANEEWNLQKEEALEEMESISTYEEAHPIIAESLKTAGGKHSFFMSEKTNNKRQSEYQIMPIVERNNNILHINLPAISNASTYGKEYAEIVLKGLQDNQDVEGIILDLQNNTGGDMGPMITAISPLLPDGEILYFSLRNGETPVSLADGMVAGGGSPVKTDIAPFKLKVSIAVLTSEMTASSGEATLMSLIPLDNVKTFGQPSAGYASGNTPYNLYDGSVMVLTGAYNKTTSGQMFSNDPIPADVETNQPFEEAVKWLEEMSLKQ